MNNPRFSNPPGKTEGVVETVKERAAEVSAAVGESAQLAKRNVQELASSAAQTAEQAWDKTRHMAEEFGAETARRAETLHADAAIFIRRNPMATVLGALGLGILIGAVACAARDRS